MLLIGNGVPGDKNLSIDIEGNVIRLPQFLKRRGNFTMTTSNEYLYVSSDNIIQKRSNNMKN